MHFCLYVVAFDCSLCELFVNLTESVFIYFSLTVWILDTGSGAACGGQSRRGSFSVSRDSFSVPVGLVNFPSRFSKPPHH